MAYYKFNPSKLTAAAPRLFYDEKLISVIEKANSAIIAMDHAMIGKAGIWVLAAKGRRVADAYNEAQTLFGTEFVRGRHAMPPHLHADLVTVLTMSEWVIQFIGITVDNAEWLKPVAPVQKRFQPAAWGRKWKSLFSRKPAPAWMPNTQLLSG